MQKKGSQRAGDTTELLTYLYLYCPSAEATLVTSWKEAAPDMHLFRWPSPLAFLWPEPGFFETSEAVRCHMTWSHGSCTSFLG